MVRPTTDHKSKLTAISGNKDAPAPIPPMPANLPKSYEPEWRGIIEHLQAHDAWVPEKASVVEIYLLNVKAVREAQLMMDLSGGILAGGKVHPSSAIIARHTGTATKLAAALGLGATKLQASKSSTPAKPTGSTWSV